MTSKVSSVFSFKSFVVLILVGFISKSLAKPLILVESDEEPTMYKDTEEILNEWNNDDSYADYSPETQDSPIISYLPPVFIDLKVPSTPEPVPTTTKRPSYFPNTNIQLGPSLQQVNRAKHNHVENSVDLPVPLIVWAHDPSGHQNKVSYWNQLKNTVYKVD